MNGPSRVHGFCETHWARMMNSGPPQWMNDFLTRAMMRGWLSAAEKKGLTDKVPPKDVQESFKREMDDLLFKGGCIVCMTEEKVLDDAIRETLDAMPNVGAG